MTRLTRSQRAQVVELLRCGADNWFTSRGGIGTATVDLYGDADQDSDTPRAWGHACRAWDDASASFTSLAGWTYGDVCLEAAQRVEDKEWP